MKKPFERLIPSLHGKGTDARNALKERVKLARQRKIREKNPYIFIGREPLREYLQGLTLDNEIIDLLIQKAKQGKIRFLDIGPGTAEYLKTAEQDLGECVNNVEFHGLSPEQINPKTIPGTNKLNPEFNPRLNHHVGMIETIDPKKLGKFNLIFSTAAATFYTRHFEEVVIKIAEMLERGGKAFLQFNIVLPIGKHVENIQKQLGDEFKVKIRMPETFGRHFIPHLMIERGLNEKRNFPRNWIN